MAEAEDAARRAAERKRDIDKGASPASRHTPRPPVLTGHVLSLPSVLTGHVSSLPPVLTGLVRGAVRTRQRRPGSR